MARPNTNKWPYHFSTPLHHAAASPSGNLEVVKLLVEKNATIDSTNEDGKTAYDRAIESGNLEVAAYLLELMSD